MQNAQKAIERIYYLAELRGSGYSYSQIIAEAMYLYDLNYKQAVVLAGQAERVSYQVFEIAA